MLAKQLSIYFTLKIGGINVDLIMKTISNGGLADFKVHPFPLICILLSLALCPCTIRP